MQANVRMVESKCVQQCMFIDNNMERKRNELQG